MAISAAFKDAQSAKAPATVGAPVPASTGAKTGAKKDSLNNKFRREGNAIRESEGFDKTIEGSKSDKVAFVACLGDPSRPQPRKEGKEDIPSFVVVGYALKALEDMMVPKANLKANFKSLMDVEEMTEVPVKEGETFYVNVFEAGVLIAKAVYAGKFTGEGESVSMSLKFSKDREEPLPVLKKDTKGSIKLNMIEIADMVANPNGGKEIPKIKDEFAEKYAVLYTKRSAGRRGSSTPAVSGEAQKDLAAAFTAYIKNKY